MGKHIMITIQGRIPSKKNARQALNLKGRCILVPNSLYRAWHKEAMGQLEGQKPSLFNQAQGLDSSKGLRIVMFAPDARAFDLTNKAESVMDVLVDAKFIEDDNFNFVPKLLLEFGGIDRENPRAEIYEITE